MEHWCSIGTLCDSTDIALLQKVRKKFNSCDYTIDFTTRFYNK